MFTRDKPMTESPAVTVIREVFTALDAGDADALLSLCALDIEVVDEVSGHWLRGMEGVQGYVRHVLLGEASGRVSFLSDFSERSCGPEAILSFWVVRRGVDDVAAAWTAGPGTAALRARSGHWQLTQLQLPPLLAQVR